MGRKLVACLACGECYPQLSEHVCALVDVLPSEPILFEPELKEGYKQRDCLRCEATFISEGAHNRLCEDCRDDKVFEYPYFKEAVVRVAKHKSGE